RAGAGPRRRRAGRGGGRAGPRPGGRRRGPGRLRRALGDEGRPGGAVPGVPRLAAEGARGGDERRAGGAGREPVVGGRGQRGGLRGPRLARAAPGLRPRAPPDAGRRGGRGHAAHPPWRAGAAARRHAGAGHRRRGRRRRPVVRRAPAGPPGAAPAGPPREGDRRRAGAGGPLDGERPVSARISATTLLTDLEAVVRAALAGDAAHTQEFAYAVGRAALGSTVGVVELAGLLRAAVQKEAAGGLSADRLQAALPLLMAYVRPQIRPLLGFSPEEWTADPGLWERRMEPVHAERALEQWAQAAT